MFGGPPPEVLKHLNKTDEFEIWPENVEPVSLFMKMQTQWRIGVAGITGLDYSGVMAALTFMGVPHTPELFGKIQVMERAVLNLRSGNKE